MYVANYFYFKNKAYVILTEDSISKSGWFKKKIEIRTIDSLNYFAGDYIIRSNGRELAIDTNLVDKESLPLLKGYFENLMHRKESAANTLE